MWEDSFIQPVFILNTFSMTDTKLNTRNVKISMVQSPLKEY